MSKIKNICTLLIFCLLLVLSSCQTNQTTPELESISIANNSITAFKVGEFDLSNILITCNYSDGKNENIQLTEEMITSVLPNDEIIGDYQIDVLYEEKTCSFEISIIDVTKLNVTTNSVNTFRLNEFDPSLLDVTATYSNETTEKINITLDMIDGVEKLNTVGTHSIKITYRGVTIEIDIEITKGDDLINYEFEALPYNEGYILNGYKGEETNLVIPSEYNGLPVKEIASQAFFKENNITRVVIPNTVTKIGEAAFYQSTSIKSVIIPSSVTTIGQYGVRGIKTIYLESTEIPSGFDASWYDEQHTYINYGIGLDDITFNGEYEYYIKENSVVLSNYFGKDANVIVPESLNGVDVTVIGGACYKDNLYIESLSMSDKIVKLEKYALAGLESLIELKLSDNITEICDYALRGCIIIEHINLPSKLTTIGHSAFNMCSELQEMILPDGVQYVGEYAFSWCVKIKKIYIPSSVQVMKVGSCYSCSIATIYVEYTSEPSTWETGWNQSNRPIKWGQAE